MGFLCLYCLNSTKNIRHLQNKKLKKQKLNKKYFFLRVFLFKCKPFNVVCICKLLCECILYNRIQVRRNIKKKSTVLSRFLYTYLCFYLVTIIPFLNILETICCVSIFCCIIIIVIVKSAESNLIIKNAYL